MNLTLRFFIVISLVAMCACNLTLPSKNNDFIPSVQKRDYGHLSNGEKIYLYELKAENIRLNVINYGGIITQLEVPDRHGNFADVVLGFDKLADYEHKNRYFGAIIGRYANRIAHGKAEIDGVDYQLSTNRKPHQLHGGHKGFDKAVWRAKTYVSDNSASITLAYTSLNGEEGYPGNLDVEVTYEITNDGRLVVTYRAKTDKTTVFNPTQHSYFNLSGTDEKVLDHELIIYAKNIVELDNEGVPTGKLLAVKNTPFDFLKAKLVGHDIKSQNKQLLIGKGYDHYFKAKNERGELTRIAELFEPNSGRKMTVSTTEIGTQLYTGNFLDPSLQGKGGKDFQSQQGLCLETGQMPNAPAESKFNSVLIKPNNQYFSQTVFAFSSQ